MLFSNAIITGVVKDHAIWSIWSGTPKKLPPLHNIVLLAGITANGDHPLLSLNNGLAVERFEISPDYQVVIAQKGLEVFPANGRGSRSSHKQSQATYLLYGTHPQKKYSLLVHYLPPESRTSCHFHTKTTEDFFSIVGSCHIGTFDLCELNAECQHHRLSYASLRVLPEHVHQMWTQKQPALSFIVMRGLPSPTDMSDHHYFESPFLK